LASVSHPIPQAALAHHIAFLGKTGSGKSNGAKTLAEEALDAGERLCVVDPTGAWWGLRLNANGKPSAYPVVILGGLRGDVAITAHNGAAVAEVVATSATPAVIDTRLMTVGQRTQFFTDFAETLLRKNRGPLRLIIDEAHVFAPQGRVSDPNSGKMLHAANNLVSLGRSIGLRIVLISQRPAKLHKDSLTQVETLVAMRLIAPQDRGAVEDWIGEWADKAQGKEIIASLPSLPTGDAWVWSPEAGFLERVHFPLATTYDSGKAPEGGEDGPELKPLDVAAVNALLDKAADDLKANDPKALKAEVARLTRDLAAATKGKSPSVAPPQVDFEAVQKALTTGFWEGWHKRGKADAEALKAVRHAEMPGVSQEPRAVPAAKPARIAGEFQPTDGSVPAGCAKPLAALAGVYPAGMTEAQWATAAGYKRSGGTWGTYKSRLTGAQLIEKRDGKFFATETGAHAVGDVEMPPAPGPDLVRWWAAKLPGTAKVAEALIDAWPNGLSKDELAAHIGMAAGGGSFGTYLSRLASPGLITRDGEIRLANEVMGG
jgi:hypothetical protein